VQRGDVAGEAVVRESETVKVVVPLTQLTLDGLATVHARRRRHVTRRQTLHLHVLQTYHTFSLTARMRRAGGNVCEKVKTRFQLPNVNELSNSPISTDCL